MTERSILSVYGGASLAAVAAGCAIAASAGVPASGWGRDLGAWALGALLVSLIAMRPRWLRSPVAVSVLALVVAVLLATFIDSGLDGVHRWISLGPIRLNAAMLLLPATIVLVAGRRDGIAWVAIAAILVAQPDASQATAFAAASLVALSNRVPDWKALATGLLVAALAVASWLRPDPLAPVAEVEGIFGLASPVLALVAGCAVAVAALAPVVAGSRTHPAALPLATYLAVVALMPAFGPYPVPLVGLTVSPILGWWLGIGVLAASLRLTRPGAAA